MIRSVLCAVLVTMFLFPFASARAEPSVSPSVVIGTIDPETGTTRLNESLLRKRFADGGVIEHFAAVPFHDGYNLLRIGKDAQGHCRTEALRLMSSEFKLKVRELRWFTTCSSVECAAFCTPNRDKTSCECLGGDGGECNFGIDVSGMGLETVLVQNPNYP